MKKLILRYFILLTLILSSLIAYLSIIGIETNKFNKQISVLIKNINNNLEIDLKQIKLILDPFNFEINIKTLGSKLKIKENQIDIQNIKTTISIISFFSNKFSLSNLEVSTNSLEIKNLISFLRNLNNTPELYILEKIVKKGYIISTINLEFDEEGKIKNSYKIKGLIKDGKLSILKTYDIEKLDLLFDVSNNDYQIKNINLLINKIPLSSEKIIIQKDNNDFLTKGSFQNKDITIEKKLINNYFNSIPSNYEIDDINFSSRSEFEFTFNKKLKIKNLQFLSELKLNSLNFKNNFTFNKFFPNAKEKINIKDHLITLNYDKNKLSIKGSGNILYQEQEDEIEYQIEKKDKKYDFKISLFLEKNPFKLDFLGYQKDKGAKANLSFNGTLIPKKNTIISSATYIEDKNKFYFSKLNFDKNFNIYDLEKVSLNYKDKDKIRNELKLKKKNNIFYFSGNEFNADYLIQRLIDNDKKNNLNFSNNNIELSIDLNNVHLDKNYKIKNLVGKFDFKNSKISRGDIEGFFSDQEKLKYTINNKNGNKVTTLFLDKAEPLVKKYKFIKGFKNGSLDFYSISNGNQSTSTLKIYDFNLKELPILTKILTLASLQGIADILSGEGITFDEFEMNFQTEENGLTVKEIYAIGPAISILMDGYYVKSDLISLRGTLVPATTINKFVGSIPVLGKILVGTKTGEGVFGVSFKIKGNPKNPKTSVNPIKTLTPRFITRTIEKIKKN